MSSRDIGLITSDVVITLTLLVIFKEKGIKNLHPPKQMVTPHIGHTNISLQMNIAAHCILVPRLK